MRCFATIGPSHSGKTTLVGALAELGSPISEASVSSGIALRSYEYLGERWSALDVPGGAENMALAKAALAAADAAVLCVPPESDAAVLAAPYLRMIEEAGIPTFLFINKMDTATERLQDIVGALQAYAAHALVLRQVPIRSDGHVTGTVDLISERAWEFHDHAPSSLVEIPAELRTREEEARMELLEHLADFDDDLLEQLVEDRKPATDRLYDLIADVHRHNDLVPACLGSAEHRNGITRLMKSLRHEAPDVTETRTRLGAGDARAVSFAGEHRKHLGKVIHLRALQAGLAQGTRLGGGNLGGLTMPDGSTPAKAEAGEVLSAIRSDHLDAGRILATDGADPIPTPMAPPPAHRTVIAPASERDDARLSAALGKLASIDPGLAVEQDEDTGQMNLATQGPMHMRRTLEQLTGEFGIEVETAPVTDHYRETIRGTVQQQYRHRKQSGGAGQFADVSLTVRPSPRGEGFAFTEEIKGGVVPRNYIPAVEQGARDALRTGPNGFPVIDIAVVLTDGKHHAVDSSDHAFRLAASAAVREALKAAKPQILQPIDLVTIHVPTVHSGGLVPLVMGLKGQILGFDTHPAAKGWDVFRALVPASSHAELLRGLMQATQGTAWCETAFDHFEEVHDKQARQIADAQAAT